MTLRYAGVKVDTWSTSPTVTTVRTSMTADDYFNSPVWSHSFGCFYGFLGNNALASLDPATGKHKQLGKPVVDGAVDFSMNHVAYDDKTGMIFTTIVPDDGSRSSKGGQPHLQSEGAKAIGKHFLVVRYTGELVFKGAAADPLMYLRVVS